MRLTWLDIGQVIFWQSRGQLQYTQKRARPIFSHPDRTSVVNNGFITWPNKELFLAGPTWCITRELKQRWWRRQWERKNCNRFILAKQHLCTCITLFCTFLCHRCTTTTWKCLISRFVEDGNTRQQLSYSFPDLWYSTPKKLPTSPRFSVAL